MEAMQVDSSFSLKLTKSISDGARILLAELELRSGACCTGNICEGAYKLIGCEVAVAQDLLGLLIKTNLHYIAAYSQLKHLQ